jgi:hypothetical protein
MPTITLDPTDAAELAELLQFIRDWVTTDQTLDVSLARFVGTAAYSPATLSSDLDRFTFLLHGNDGEALFQPEAQ